MLAGVTSGSLGVRGGCVLSLYSDSDAAPSSLGPAVLGGSGSESVVVVCCPHVPPTDGAPSSLGPAVLGGSGSESAVVVCCPHVPPTDRAPSSLDPAVLGGSESEESAPEEEGTFARQKYASSSVRLRRTAAKRAGVPAAIPRVPTLPIRAGGSPLREYL